MTPHPDLVLVPAALSEKASSGSRRVAAPALCTAASLSSLLRDVGEIARHEIHEILSCL